MSGKSHKNISCETCSVKECSLFGTFSEEELRQLDNEKVTSFYKKNQPVFMEDTYPRGVFCINSGKVKIFSIGENGKEQIIHIAKEGEVIGFRSLFSDEPYRLSGTTLEDAHICFIKKEEFYRHLETKPSLLQSILKNLSIELGERAVFIKDMAQKTVRERLATVLLVLNDVYGEEMINLSREDMANFVGTATETVIRLLKEMKDEKIIEIHTRKIAIINLAQLQQEAGI